MKFTRQQWQWIFYDWANSGYGILVVTAVLPVYFKAVADHAGCLKIGEIVRYCVFADAKLL